MASSIAGIRVVKCPRCHILLPELAEVPVYRCGGCDTILRAKNRGFGVEGASSSASLQTNSQNFSDNGSVRREPLPEVRQSVPCSSEVNAVAERLPSSDIVVSNSGGGDNPDRIEGCSDNVDAAIERRNSGDHDGVVQVRQGHSSDERTEMSMHPSPQDCSSSPSRYKVEQPLESNAIDAILPEAVMKLRGGSSHSYDGSVSSLDGSGENRIPDKYLLLSRRTFRKKKVQDQKLRATSMDDDSVFAVKGSFNSEGDELPSRPHIRAMERDTTFGSEDFHSVGNWIGSETDVSEDLHWRDQDQRPSAKLDCPELDHVRILRKMDELRDELSGFLTRTAEGKRASQLNRRTRFSHVPDPHNMHCEASKAQPVDTRLDKLPCREKQPVVKSHCRPVTGGAPFVICYKCWKLLQLPADFLVTRKRLHKLRCGACSEVLVFSFRPRDRAVPITPVEVRHPPSEAENNNDRTGWDPISYSDDYGVSFVQSYSSEHEPVLHVSRNSSYSTEGIGSQGGRVSRLHRLMGYSSASELLFKPRGVDEGYQSTAPSTPHFYRPSGEMRYGQNGTGIVVPNSMEIEEEDEPQERLRNRRKVAALQGLLKKGVRELSHGLENVKLKIHPNR